MGRAHARGYLKVPGCRVVAGAETDPERSQKFVETSGAQRMYTDYRDMLEKEALDLISVCTWPTTHCEITLAAAERRPRGILCEKPLCVTLSEADRMLEACRRHRVALATGHQHRYDAQAIQARAWIDAGRIGDPVMFWGHCSLDLMNNGTHVVDLIHYFNGDRPAQWVMGQIDCRSRAKGRANHPDMVVEDMGIGEVRYANGLRATVELGAFAPQAYQFHLFGTEGMIDVNPPGGPPVRLLSSSGRGWETPEIQQPIDATYLKVIEFVKAVDEGREPACSGLLGRQILEVLIGIFESSRRRALIEFPVQARDFPLRTMIEEGLI
jgi:predicted dehydrogenase